MMIVPEPGARVLRCDDCGAAVGYDAELQAPRCGFCGATMHVEQPVDPVELATLRVPFEVEREEAFVVLRTWLSSRGWFAPRALRDEAVLHELTGLSWAGWVVNARAEVAWTADSNAGAKRSAWAPHAGQVTVSFEDLVVPASRGLTRPECEKLAPHYDVGTALAASGDEASIERFEAQRSAARGLVLRAIEAHAATRVERHIPGDRFRNVHVACRLEAMTTDRVALPAWILAYRFRGRPYRAIVHGQKSGIVIGRAPIDRAKVALLAAVAIGVALAIVLLTACGDGTRLPIDAPSFVEPCVPDRTTFAPLTGRVAVQAALDVHVEAGGLIKVDTTSTLLVALDLDQTGADLAVVAEVCAIEIPDVPLAGQDKPIHFEIAPATIASVGKVAGTGRLGSADQTCTDIHSDPITLVLGARVDPGGALPVAADDGAFPECAPAAETPCAVATGSPCACDQESDGKPGATLRASNVPIVDIDEAYVALRTSFSLAGQVFSTDAFNGTVDATLDTTVLACRLRKGTPCIGQDLRSVRNLAPVVTQQPDVPSTFRAVRVATGLSCPDIVAQRALLFPR